MVIPFDADNNLWSDGDAFLEARQETGQLARDRKLLQVVSNPAVNQVVLDGKVDVGDFIAVKAYTINCELREVTAISGDDRIITVGENFANTPASGDTVVILTEPVRHASLWGVSNQSTDATNRDGLINAIADADANVGNLVVIGEVSFTTDQTIELPLGVSLHGVGRKGVTINSSLTSGPIIKMIGSSTNHADTELSRYSHELRNVTLRPAADETNAEGLQMLGCRHAVVSDVTVWSLEDATPADNGIGINVLPGDDTSTGGRKGSAYNSFINITVGSMGIGIIFDMTPDSDASTFTNRNAGYNWRLQSCDVGFRTRGYISDDAPATDQAPTDSHQVFGLRTADCLTIGIDLIGTDGCFLVIFCEDPSASTAELNIGKECSGNQIVGFWNTFAIDSSSGSLNYLINPKNALAFADGGGAQLFKLRCNDIQVDDEISILNSNSALITSLTNPAIYGTSSGGSGVFSEAGNLILQPRLSGADRRVVIFAGTSGNQAAKFSETSVEFPTGRIFEQAGGAHNVETLSGDKTLTTTSPKFHKFDTGGSNRNCDLPAEASSDGLSFWIANEGAEDLAVRDDTPSTIATLNSLEAAWFVCNGTTWVHMGLVTIAAS